MMTTSRPETKVVSSPLEHMEPGRRPLPSTFWPHLDDHGHQNGSRCQLPLATTVVRIVCPAAVGLGQRQEVEADDQISRTDRPGVIRRQRIVRASA
jgi:hypothetical protein